MALVRMSVYYPKGENERFDHDYYRDTHMPLVAKRMGEHCKHYTVDKGGKAPKKR